MNRLLRVSWVRIVVTASAILPAGVLPETVAVSKHSKMHPVAEKPANQNQL